MIAKSLRTEFLARRSEPSFAGSFRPSEKREPRSRASMGEPCLAFLEDWERSPREAGQPIKSLDSRTQVVDEPLVTIEAGDQQRGDDEAGQTHDEIEIGRARGALDKLADDRRCFCCQLMAARDSGLVHKRIAKAADTLEGSEPG
jgi:hypothetical protein